MTEPLDPATCAAVAQFVVDVIPGLDDRTVDELDQLIGLRLTFPTAAELRDGRLGLLLEMIAVSQGVFPQVPEYRAERKARKALGEIWPDASTISRAYKGWDRACRAAMRLHHLGGASRVQGEPHYQRPRDSYTREEILAAIDRFWRDHDRCWPQYTEFFKWGEKLRRDANRRGDRDPRIPCPNQVIEFFPDGFYAAVEEARTHRTAK